MYRGFFVFSPILSNTSLLDTVSYEWSMKNQKVQFKIDDWVFYPYEDKFVLHGEDIVIDNRLSKLFHFLCENPDTVFSRDELINEVWNGSILTDQVITQAIFELRKILKQHGNHPYGYIVTVPKRGYKLDATVEKSHRNTSTCHRNH